MTGQLFEVGPTLTPRQTLVYEACAVQPLDALAAGIVAHTAIGCRWCQPGRPCKFAASSGRQVLEALRKKGLLARDRHHVYRRADTPVAEHTTLGYDPATAPIPY